MTWSQLYHIYHTYQALWWQLCRYGLMGLLAASIHFILVIFLVQKCSQAPLMANMLAYPFSFQISYWGHRLWTFDGTTAPHLSALPKLITVQIINFIIGQSLFYSFLKMHLPYQAALLIVLSILPFFTFLSSRLWVFR